MGASLRRAVALTQPAHDHCCRSDRNKLNL
nr:MAG TPA: hypothetical protein [Caudoviricetes sp.]